MADARTRTGRLPAAPLALIVHGGAWDIPDDETRAHRECLEAALELGRTLLESGAAATSPAGEIWMAV